MLATLCVTLLVGTSPADHVSGQTVQTDLDSPLVAQQPARRHRRGDPLPSPGAEERSLERDVPGSHPAGHRHGPRVLVYAQGEGLTAANAIAIEDPLTVLLESAPTPVRPMAGTAAKVEVSGLDPACNQPGACVDLLALALDAEYILTCQVLAGNKLKLDLRPARSSEVIATAAVTYTSSSALVAEAAAAIEQLFASLPAGPAPAITPLAVAAPATETLAAPPARPAPAPRVRPGAATPAPAQGPMGPPAESYEFIPNQIPFWMALATTGIALTSALWYAAQFEAQNDKYVNEATGWDEVRGEQLLGLRAQVKMLADVGNALWAATGTLAVGTVLIAIFTDWSGRGRLTATVQPDGAAASLSVDF